MEDFKAALDSLNIDILIVLMVLAGGFWAKTYLDTWTHIRIGSWRPAFSNAWKTLIVGTILCAVYLAIRKSSGDLIDGEEIKRSFVSYVFATSFYELILGPFTKFLQSKFGTSQN